MSNTMEDCGLFAVDCVVVCCCCPCLLLQVTVFLFIRLPHRLAVRSKRIVLRKLHRRSKKHDRIKELGFDSKKAAFGAQGGYNLVEGHFFLGDRSSFLEAGKVLEELMKSDRSSWLEAEKAWEELIAEEGLFWFGSFWGITG